MVFFNSENIEIRSKEKKSIPIKRIKKKKTLKE